MKLKIELDKDKIELLKHMQFKRVSDTYYAIDTYDLFGGTYIWEDMANILGLQDKVIPETLEDPKGCVYEPETQEYLEKLDVFILDNFVFLMEIVHQFLDKGIKPGIYTATDNCRIWKYEGEVK